LFHRFSPSSCETRRWSHLRPSFQRSGRSLVLRAPLRGTAALVPVAGSVKRFFRRLPRQPSASGERCFSFDYRERQALFSASRFAAFCLAHPFAVEGRRTLYQLPVTVNFFFRCPLRLLAGSEVDAIRGKGKVVGRRRSVKCVRVDPRRAAYCEVRRAASRAVNVSGLRVLFVSAKLNRAPTR
jgi:hypothetical protein